MRSTTTSSIRPYQLCVANSLWGRKDETWKREFLDLVESRYAAGLQYVDFAADPDSLRADINNWIKKWTRGKIKDIIEPGMLTPDTALVLANAIYFKGNWANRFDKQNTNNATFHLGTGRTTEVPMMYQKAVFRHAGFGDVEVLHLLYEGKSISMVILLPGEYDGLAKLEASLTREGFNQLIQSGQGHEVEVYMPRFKIESTLQLREPLEKMGMKSAFGPSADFSGMNGKRNLFISRVVHKAVIEVNEDGSEAGAGTIAQIEKSAAKQRPHIPVFRADHPFLFAIRDERSGDILFLGRVVNPAQ
jgi:serpin B